jgi:hypothetical protein
MSADFQISFPAFSMRRVLKEACASWNLRHPDNHADPDESEWPLLYNALHAYCRHELCGYDQALAAGADRDQLRERISRAACRAWPWLKVERDPRTSDDADTAPERRDYRPFNSFSKQLSDLVSERSLLTLAIKDTRRHRVAGWREHVSEMEERLAAVNTRVDQLNKLFKPSARVEGGTLVNYIWAVHTVAGYDFGGRGELPESYTKTTGIKCPSCQKAVMRTKTGIDHGAGKRQIAFSCHCMSMSVESKYAYEIGLTRWTEMVGKRDQNTDIVVYDTDGALLYGHQQLIDVDAGRKDASKIREFRGVMLDAFHALLMVKFADHPLVQALEDGVTQERVTQELLEQISAELVLTADDIERVLESQERVASASD